MYIGDGFAFVTLRGVINISKQALVGKLPLELGYMNFHVIVVYNLVATNTNMSCLHALIHSHRQRVGMHSQGLPDSATGHPSKKTKDT